MPLCYSCIQFKVYFSFDCVFASFYLKKNSNSSCLVLSGPESFPGVVLPFRVGGQLKLNFRMFTDVCTYRYDCLGPCWASSNLQNQIAVLYCSYTIALEAKKTRLAFTRKQPQTFHVHAAHTTAQGTLPLHHRTYPGTMEPSLVV